MGYSMGARARNVSLKKRMLAFLDEHYRCWPEIMGEEERFWWYNSSPPKGSPDLSYDRTKLALGFDHSGLHGWERFYLYTVSRWIALQVGQRKRKFSSDTIEPNVLDEPAPFMTYDGDTHWPVIVRTVEEAAKLPEGQQWCANSPLGLPTGPRRFHRASHQALEDSYDNKELFAAIRADMDKFPKDSPDIIQLHESVWLRHLEVEIKEGFAKVQAEMERLDQLWSSSQGS